MRVREKIASLCYMETLNDSTFHFLFPISLFLFYFSYFPFSISHFLFPISHSLIHLHFYLLIHLKHVNKFLVRFHLQLF
jgi:hypothetical protein